MSTRSIRQVLVVAFGLSLSSLALARTPAPLAARQQAAASATQEGGGYRDMNYRFGAVAERMPGTVKVSGGYRDIHTRLAQVTSNRETASAQAPSQVR
jgi:hypothetical protein